MEMTFFEKDAITMRDGSLSHTRENNCVCNMRAVRCRVYTLRRLQRNRCGLQAKTLKKTKICAQCSFQSHEDHQVFGEDDLHHRVEEDNVEEDNHTQPVLGSTMHVSDF